MTAKKTTPLVLMIFTLMCALPVAAGAVPTAIAQEDDDEDASLLDDENLATGIVSNVLDGGSGDNNEEENGASAAGDDTNTQTAVPVTDQDQRDANLAEQRAANLDLDIVKQPTPTPTTPTPTTQPPEDEDVFCLEDRDFGVLCFGTLEECEFVEALFVGFIVSECKEFETPPSDAAICRVVEEDPPDVICEPDPF